MARVTDAANIQQASARAFERVVRAEAIPSALMFRARRAVRYQAVVSVGAHARLLALAYEEGQ